VALFDHRACVILRGKLMRRFVAYNVTRVMNIVGTKPLMACDLGLRPNRSWLLTDLPEQRIF
jgi:hypothetical protein